MVGGNNGSPWVSGNRSTIGDFPHLFFRRIKELSKDITGLPGQTAADFCLARARALHGHVFRFQITMKAIPRIGWMFFLGYITI